MVFLANKTLFLAYNSRFLAFYCQIQSIILRQKQGFAKILCACRRTFRCMQILFFPLPSPHSPHPKREKVLFSSFSSPQKEKRKEEEPFSLSPSSLIFPTIKTPPPSFKIPKEKGEEEEETHCFEGFERVWRGRGVVGNRG